MGSIGTVKRGEVAEINLPSAKIYNDSAVILSRIERIFDEDRSHDK